MYIVYVKTQLQKLRKINMYTVGLRVFMHFDVRDLRDGILTK